jgi:hypothetical protein
MPRDNIWNETDGRQLAWIEDGKIFDVATEKQVGTMRDGNLYSPDGKFVGHLEHAWQVHTTSGNKTPDAFLNLLKVD